MVGDASVLRLIEGFHRTRACTALQALGSLHKSAILAKQTSREMTHLLMGHRRQTGLHHRSSALKQPGPPSPPPATHKRNPSKIHSQTLPDATPPLHASPRHSQNTPSHTQRRPR